MKLRIAIYIALLALVALAAEGQHCGCSTGMCCSRWGYCGTTSAYCGKGCQAGSCTVSTPSTPSDGGGGGDITSIVSAAFFDRIKAGSSSACKGKSFYTYDGFVAAANAFPAFAGTGSLDDRKREAAAFLANMARETGSMCYVEEIQKSRYCQPSTKYPCESGKMYYGRGPLQLTWNYNYGSAGDYIGKDLLSQPELVASDPAIAFKTSLWFWNVHASCHSSFNAGRGFQSTIRCINGGECGNPRFENAVEARVSNYKKFCSWLGVDPGANLYC